MSDSDTIFAFPAPKSGPKKLHLPKPSKEQAKKPAIVLDMGEASREEGFRLNGCR